MALSTEIGEILDKYQFLVTYTPLRTEVPVADFLRISQELSYCVAPRPSLDPHEEATKATRAAASRPTAILIPGRRFDALGTRHGQGGGWYDRFLAEVPPEWFRIGFCFDDQFSPAPLLRQPWDRSMDLVVLVDRKTNALTLYSCQGRTEL
jgi:5,10-methenyltetrahydrofolate synthetase